MRANKDSGRRWSLAIIAGCFLCAALAAGCGDKYSYTGMCGNGSLDGNEECDGAELNGQTCETLGLQAGTLACSESCTFDTTGCGGTSDCGNGEVEGEEDCDTDNLDGQSCESLGLGQGTLACDGECSFDVSSCSGQAECGNGQIEWPEPCDGTNLNDEDCQSQGYYEGELACRPDCQGFDLEGCSGTCGNNVIEEAGNEICDGTSLNGETCETQGYYHGDLACSSDCQSYDLSGCVGTCGDNQITDDEMCDGTDLGGASCESEGFGGGELACLEGCHGFDTSGCFSVLINEVALNIFEEDYVELINLSSDPVDLEGYTLHWWGVYESGNESGSVELPAYSLEAGGFVVIYDDPAGNGDPPTADPGNHAIQLHVNILWVSDPGACALEDDGGRALDFVRWGDGTFAPPTGYSFSEDPSFLPDVRSASVSLSRRTDGADNNVSSDFCVAPLSPAAANNACRATAAPSTLLITEIDVGNPDRIEIYNPGPGSVDLQYWALYWTSNYTGTNWGGTFLPSYTLDAGNYVVILDTGTPGTVDSNGIPVSNINWSNDLNGSCGLWSPSFEGVDFVRWGGSTWEPRPPDSWADTPAALPLIPSGSNIGRQNLTDQNQAGDFCRMAPSMGSANTLCISSP